jgi:hypothetical protein
MAMTSAARCVVEVKVLALRKSGDAFAICHFHDP